MRKILMAATALCCMTMTMIAEPVSPRQHDRLLRNSCRVRALR